MGRLRELRNAPPPDPTEDVIVWQRAAETSFEQAQMEMLAGETAFQQAVDASIEETDLVSLLAAVDRKGKNVNPGQPAVNNEPSNAMARLLADTMYSGERQAPGAAG